MTLRLTKRQKLKLRRMHDEYAGYSAPMERRLGQQLVKKGLAFDTRHVSERMEWGRCVARLPVFSLTLEGRVVAARLAAEAEKVRAQDAG